MKATSGGQMLVDRVLEDGAAVFVSSDEDAGVDLLEDDEDESSKESSEQDNTYVPPDVSDNVITLHDEATDNVNKAEDHSAVVVVCSPMWCSTTQ